MRLPICAYSDSLSIGMKAIIAAFQGSVNYTDVKLHRRQDTTTLTFVSYIDVDTSRVHTYTGAVTSPLTKEQRNG